MYSFNLQVDSPDAVLERYISVKAAAECSDYSSQYLRRLLRNGRLEGRKIGQKWLISPASLEAYLSRGRMLRDRRHGPRKTVADVCEGKTRRRSSYRDHN